MGHQEGQWPANQTGGVLDGNSNYSHDRVSAHHAWRRFRRYRRGERPRCRSLQPWKGPDDVNIEGRPDSLDPGDRGAVYIWHDSDDWHLRATDIAKPTTSTAARSGFRQGPDSRTSAPCAYRRTTASG